jgi:hypothetical protein
MHLRCLYSSVSEGIGEERNEADVQWDFPPCGTGCKSAMLGTTSACLTGRYANKVYQGPPLVDFLVPMDEVVYQE